MALDPSLLKRVVVEARRLRAWSRALTEDTRRLTRGGHDRPRGATDTAGPLEQFLPALASGHGGSPAWKLRRGRHHRRLGFGFTGGDDGHQDLHRGRRGLGGRVGAGPAGPDVRSSRHRPLGSPRHAPHSPPGASRESGTWLTIAARHRQVAPIRSVPCPPKASARARAWCMERLRPTRPSTGAVCPFCGESATVTDWRPSVDWLVILGPGLGRCPPDRVPGRPT